MASKRPRIVPSSSSQEIGLFNQIQPFETPSSIWQKQSPAPPLNAMAAPKQPEQPRMSIFTVGSLVAEESNVGWSSENVDERYGAFLQTCFFCKKNIGDHAYMYGYLRAFCTPECRNKQIWRDVKVTKRCCYYDSSKELEAFGPKKYFAASQGGDDDTQPKRKCIIATNSFKYV